MLKRLAGIFILTTVFICIFFSQAFAQPIPVYIDDVQLNFTNDPIIENGTTLVEFRLIFEKLGLKVGWDATSQTVTGEKEDLKIQLQIGSTVAYVNGVQKELLLAPRILNSRTLVPLRFVGEASGARVDWYEKTRTIHIRYSLDNQLISAVFDDDVNKIKDLLAKGANPNYVKNNRSALEWAVPIHEIQTISALINGGADINSKNRNGATPLMIAITYGRDDVAELLINAGADLTIKDKNGKTALQQAEEDSLAQLSPEYRIKNERIIQLIEEAMSNTPKEPSTIDSDKGVFEKINGVSGVSELLSYLQENYSRIETPAGTWLLTFNITENDSSIFTTDYYLYIDWNPVQGLDPYELKYSIKISDEDRIKTMEILTQLQKEIASVAFQALPDKKIEGAFYSGFYKYPHLKVGYESIRFLTWTNYEPYYGDYEDSKITGFHWYGSNDDYDFVRENDSIGSVIDSNEKTQDEIRDTDWIKSASETTGYDWVILTTEQKEVLVNEMKEVWKNEGKINIKDTDWFITKLDDFYKDDSQSFMNVKSALNIIGISDEGFGYDLD